MLVADPGRCKPWRILIEGVPVLDGRHLEEFEEGEENGDCQGVNHPEEVGHGRVHVRVDVEQEHYVDYRDELRTVLNRAPCPYEDKGEELEEIGVAKVHVVDVASELLWENHRGPKVVARSLHEVKDK